MVAGVIKTLLPHTPSILSASLYHITGRSPTSSHWDLRTTLTLEIIRAFIAPSANPHPVERAQKFLSQPQKVTDDTVKVDVSYGKISAEEGKKFEEAIVEAIKWGHPSEVDVGPVGIAEEGLTAEWVGRSTGKGQMELSDQERWNIINKGVEDDRTVLYAPLPILRMD